MIGKLAPSLEQRTSQLVSGHRGACSMAPENTLAAYREAYYHGADMISIDVHRTADNQLVVIHDPTVDRTTNGHGAVHDLTLAQLRSLDAGSWFSPLYRGETIRTLDEVLDWAKGKMQVDIELKQPSSYPGLEQQVAATLRAHHMEHEAMVDSFDHAAAARFKQLAPEIKTGYLISPLPWVRSIKHSVEVGVFAGGASGMALGALVGRTLGAIPGLGSVGVLVGSAVGYGLGSMLGRKKAFRDCSEAPVDLVLPQWALLTRHWVSTFHRSHVGVIPYTENNRLEVGRLLHRLGVDTIITDCPQRFDPHHRDPQLELRERCVEALEHLGPTSASASSTSLQVQAPSASSAALVRAMLRPQVGRWSIAVEAPSAGGTSTQPSPAARSIASSVSSSPASAPPLAAAAASSQPNDLAAPTAPADLASLLGKLPRVAAVQHQEADNSWHVQVPQHEDVDFLTQLLEPTVQGAHVVVEQAHRKS
jgi:glycerophosphoryl diester phosphodiesterase